MGVILAANPHRVFLSRIGRIEVFTPIPPPGGASPEGPHTHVLPKLLQHKRTHAATEPVPAGFVPCAHLYPAHPLKDALGRAQAFDASRHAHFQEILRRFGDPGTLALKRRVAAAVRQNGDPAQLEIPNERFARAAIRVALRQLLAENRAPPSLPAWLARHDRTQSAELDGDVELEHL
jgi:hypothetical protein